MQKHVGQQLHSMRMPEVPQKQLVNNANDDNIDNEGRIKAWPGQKTFRLRLRPENRDNDSDEAIDLDREVAEEGDQVRGHRQVLGERLRNIEIELNAQAEPRHTRDHRRATAL